MTGADSYIFSLSVDSQESVSSEKAIDDVVTLDNVILGTYTDITSFTGCIYEMSINGDEIGLIDDASTGYNIGKSIHSVVVSPTYLH